MERLKKIKAELFKHGESGILDFWCKYSIDTLNGGLYGELDYKGGAIKEAHKGLVQHARFLYSFSLAYEVYKKSQYLDYATKTYSFLTKHFYDPKNEGYFYKVAFNGKPVMDIKHIYAESFVVYALSEYAIAGNVSESFDKALSLFRKIEKIARDDKFGGYAESFSVDWKEIDQPSDYGIAGKRKTMNTHIHLLEAYTSLLKACKHFGKESEKREVKKSLQELANLVSFKIFRPSVNSLGLYFEKDWSLLPSPISYGHDIELSWLLGEANHELENPERLSEHQEVQKRLIANVVQYGIDSKSGKLFYEGDETNKIIKSDAVWWSQAESMVGLYLGYKDFKDEKMLKAFYGIYDWCMNTQFDKEHLEWFENPAKREMHKGHNWKTPYHNLRACMTVYKNID